MNGYANYETWNVALWIGNDEGLYNEAKRLAKFGRMYQDLVSCCMSAAAKRRLMV